MGVKTTGIFCRPGCPARTPLEKNVTFFPAARQALSAGFRPCKKCRPLEVTGAFPGWLDDLIKHVQQDPARNWKDRDIRDFGVDPKRVLRWFQQNHGITFHSFLRSRRLSTALAQLSVGQDPARVALDAGFESTSGFRDAFQKWFGVTPNHVQTRRGRDVPAPKTLCVNRILTPLGPMVIAASEQHIHLLEFADRQMLPTQFARLSRLTDCRFCPGENSLVTEAASQLEQYFSGQRVEFTLPLHITGTEFQKLVWRQLMEIPFGQTNSYEEIAARIQKPGAQRAVGRANGDNRLAVVVPCHRVIRADGQLSGYAGGLRRKQWLLDLEMSVAATQRR
jgi:AraC family transcriptional regulator of adaptative response/methylated-DNA-[protein]-cysteine methyltransferase